MRKKDRMFRPRELRKQKKTSQAALTCHKHFNLYQSNIFK